MAIERKFIAQNLKEFRIKEFIASQLKSVGLSDIKLQRTPLGDKVLITASRPGLVVGRGGSNIHRLTDELKERFTLENPQIEIEEIESIGLDAAVMAEMIINSLERFGAGRFKGLGHRAMSDIMNAGALGVEILISGKVPSSRSRTWRFYQGYLKKCGDVAVTGVNIAYRTAVLKTGAVGVKVSILPPTTKLPDHIELHEATIEEVPEEQAKEELKEAAEGEKEETKDAKSDKVKPKKVEKEEKGAVATEAEPAKPVKDETSKAKPAEPKTPPKADETKESKPESEGESDKEVKEEKSETKDDDKSESAEEKPNDGKKEENNPPKS